VSELAAAFGMSTDQYLGRLRAMDTSTYSAVCDQCISLFENDIPVPEPQFIAQPPAPQPSKQPTVPQAQFVQPPAQQAQFVQPPAPQPPAPQPPAQQPPAQQPPAPQPPKQQPPAPQTPYAQSPTPSKPTDTSPNQKKRKVNPYILGGVAIFIAIAGALLYLGIFSVARRSQNVGDAEQPVQRTPYIEDINDEDSNQEDPVMQEPGLTEEEENILAEIVNILPGKIEEASRDSMYISLLQAAAANAQIIDPEFSDYGVTVTVLLPDPSIESLRNLNIAPYTPLSGAQVYIKENYQNLKNMAAINECMAIDVNLPYLQSGAAVKELDWSFPNETFVIMEYSAIFEPHMEQYMTELGFYTAVKEILMPDFQRWASHTGDVSNQAFLDSYFHSLAEALSYKGVEYRGNTIVDVAQIEQLLNQRFARSWAFDGLSAGRDHFLSSLKLNTYNHGILFNEVIDLKQAQYSSGTVARPTSYEALEQEFLAKLEEQINDSFDMLSKNMSAGVDPLNYYFEWEELGEKGISACPDLLDYIRTFLYSYDTYLGILAHPDL